jgi:hypothetical protein
MNLLPAGSVPEPDSEKITQCSSVRTFCFDTCTDQERVRIRKPSRGRPIQTAGSNHKATGTIYTLQPTCPASLEDATAEPTTSQPWPCYDVLSATVLKRAERRFPAGTSPVPPRSAHPGCDLTSQLGQAQEVFHRQYRTRPGTRSLRESRCIGRHRGPIPGPAGERVSETGFVVFVQRPDIRIAPQVGEAGY